LFTTFNLLLGTCPSIKTSFDDAAKFTAVLPFIPLDLAKSEVETSKIFLFPLMSGITSSLSNLTVIYSSCFHFKATAGSVVADIY
jgi:hypothetical protein